ncbi:hypothetical protein [Oryza sativa Japonica Group]|uniref:Uncharacterized protein n=3 Tax=Oryza sativa TaxID=4530 RepID=Q7F426_ORYSJ|nr:hypothetical protein OsI_02898 [Oryza sativa Indica Group]BAB17175.1 hypothetical protein [Oryza sativa Japonica Group]BAB67975.1 hypothetical protein [Oryza sativa Japonica Group]BAS73205.1 Os01g0620200 [Oryza sativa Japonica Group]
MARTPVAAESGSDLRFGLLEEGRPHPPVVAAAAAALVGGAQRRRNSTPPWLHALRLFCIIAATAMVAVFAAWVFPRCKGKQDVLLCVVALAGAVFTGPILGFLLTTCAADADDHEAAARVASRYTRCEENVGRSVILAVALLGLYAIYLAAVSCGGEVDRFLLAAYYGVMGVGVIVGHSVSWIMVNANCFFSVVAIGF